MDDSSCTTPAAAPPLPVGSRLVHIGPHKTGTTALQSALFDARERLAEHGVDYPGDDRHPMHAALAVAAKPSMLGDREPKAEHWQELVRTVAASGARTAMVSSEFLAEADDATIRRIVDDLGGPLVHVMVTVRPLVKISPSQWQQYVQNGLRMGYHDWLERMLRKPAYEQPNPSFWQRHAHDRLVERWTAVVGPERLTVIVVGDSDRDMLLRAVESLLSLPAMTLVPVPDAANRSLTPGEVEMIRLFNVEFRRSDLPEQLYSKLLRYGALPRMKTGWEPSAGGQRIVTPGWAGEKAAEIGARVAERITELGVRVIGDVHQLSRVPATPPDADGPGTTVLDAAAAAQALFGAIATAGTALQAPPKSLPVHQVKSTDLVRVLTQRAGRRVTRTVRRHRPAP